jgi:hypothetical protein
MGSELVWTLSRTASQELQELEGHGNLFVKEIVPYSQLEIDRLAYSVAPCEVKELRFELIV